MLSKADKEKSLDTLGNNNTITEESSSTGGVKKEDNFEVLQNNMAADFTNLRITKVCTPQLRNVMQSIKALSLLASYLFTIVINNFTIYGRLIVLVARLTVLELNDSNTNNSYLGRSSTN